MAALSASGGSLSALSAFATLHSTGSLRALSALGAGSLGGLATLHSATLHFATLDHNFGGASNGLVLARTTVLEEEVRSLGTGCQGGHQNSVKHE